MKIWIKYLIGILAGVILGVFIPNTSFSLISEISDLVIRIGKYAVYPLVFFSFSIAVYKMMEEKDSIKTFLYSLFFIVFNTFVVLLIGATVAFIINPRRIPIITEEVAQVQASNWIDVFKLLIPDNVFNVFLGANALLPILFFSFMIGIHLNYDKRETLIIKDVLDTLGKLFYQMNSLIVELLSLGMIALGTFYTIQWKMVEDITPYLQVVLIIGIFTVFLLFVIYPLLTMLITKTKNPYQLLRGYIGSIMAALISGNSIFAYGTIVKESRENLGIPRKIGAIHLPLNILFGRPGTAVITAVSFFVILRSYSSLEITIFQYLWTFGFSFLISFTLPFHSYGASYVALSMLCGLYGKGMEDGFLNLQPILFVLSSFGASIDAGSALVNGYFTSDKLGRTHKINPKYYI
ncbi:dicarboxylate/amino acid:cation symporter [Spirochaeta cellobiosiphila]|uniref:dicarboxylate/amino acid:cation symporter n=1 Tax=Spirochaeta cellobiosiphila TaxID=504483 RepID=UPI000412FDD2|nr:cation:dicarboxylase symporter family transporter [Spirochaeta cellobiosiphila]